MEEIKCPSCGSGAVRKITEEKYECMACDNLFLVHNLSKELPVEVEEMVWITVIKMP